MLFESFSSHSFQERLAANSDTGENATRLIISIDTEEDNWGDARSGRYPVTNIRHLLELENEVFAPFDARITYLVTTPVATSDESVSILRKILAGGRAEIGAHCHPWNTPPFQDEELVVDSATARQTMLCALSPQVQYEKLRILRRQITDAFGAAPISFRAGRWGYSAEVAHNLVRLGFKVDSSVSPYMDWSKKYGPDFSGVPLKSFHLKVDEVFPGSYSEPLLEIPATISYLQENTALANRVYHFINRSKLKQLHLLGLLNKLKLINRVWLSPETQTTEEMITLTTRLLKNRTKLLNLVFHSPTLQIGSTPFVKTQSDRVQFFNRLRSILRFLSDNGVETMTLNEAYQEMFLRGELSAPANVSPAQPVSEAVARRA